MRILQSLRFIFLFVVIGLVTGCAVPPLRSDSVSFPSRDPVFLGSAKLLAAAPARSIRAALLLPEQHAGPLPAVVLLHGAQGQGVQEWSYAERLNSLGVAVLAVDSFGPRDVERTIKDQTLVTETTMLWDAFAALAYLREDRRFDPERIGVMGFSKGAVAALYSAFAPIRKRFAPHSRGFAFHVAYYPWCGLILRDPRPEEAPILVHIGDEDTVTPASHCSQLAAQVLGAYPSSSLDLRIYPGAKHAFDHPLLEIFESVPVHGMLPGNCKIEEDVMGRFRETASGLYVTPEDLGEILRLCGLSRAEAGGDETSAEEAWRATEALIRKAFAL